MSTKDKAVLDAAEQALDQIEDRLDVIEKVPSKLMALAHDSRVHILVVFAAGAGLGYVITYKLLNKKLQTKFEEISEKEIAEAKEFYKHLRITERPKSPEEVLAELHGQEIQDAATALTSYKAGSVGPIDGGRLESVQPIEEKHNIFTDAEPSDVNVFDYQIEQKIRDANPDRPYIISEEEYIKNETGHEQTQMVFYEGDITLADDKEIPVPDIDAVVGDDNLTRFGHGSNDKNILFVRNDSLELEFEIARHEGKYQVVVMGFDDPDKELQHSHRPHKHRHWDDDDT